MKPRFWGSQLSAHDKIDVCRGLFAFLVVAAHALMMSWEIDPNGHRRLPGLAHHLLEHAAGNGVYWVMGFFVISGYCIALSARRLVDGHSFPLQTYLLARLSRIAPLYYVALLFAVCVEWWIASDRPTCWTNGLSANVVLCQVFLVQNLAETFGCYAASWSITNEVFYYVFYGLILFGAATLNRRPAAIGMAVCVAIGAGTQVVFRLVYHSHFVMQLGLLFGLGINWFLGALVAEHGAWLVRNRRVCSFARCWPLLLVASIGMWCSRRVLFEFIYVSLGLTFALMLVQFLGDEARDGDTRPGLTARQKSIVAILGFSSYPTYLFHGPILMLTGWMILHWKLALDWRATWALSAGVAISCGIALGHLAERPIMAWRASWLKGLKSSRRSPERGRGNQPAWAQPPASSRAWRTP
jgi:peptidoglycan/LPS O-acetylase OafA/YrhL